MRRATRSVTLLAAATVLGGAVACRGEGAAPLAPAAVDPARVAVAGLSSGAYMATQVHVALNARVRGAALVAGGPYGCAQGSLETALGPCMTGQPAPPDVARLAASMRDRSEAGRVDPLDAFAGDRVLVLHGTRDATVSPSLAPLTAALYREAGGDALAVTLDDARPFGHGLPTPEGPAPCDAAASPWLLDCGFDGAALVMATLFGDSVSDAGAAAGPPGTPVESTAPRPDGTLQAFDQRELLGGEAPAGLARTGFVYTPAACASGGCGALVAFHGCRQDAASVGEAFVRDAGFNRWADVHRVVVVYPQARSSYVPLNPNACWDWWGYGGTDYDTRDGAQVRFVSALLDRLLQPR